MVHREDHDGRPGSELKPPRRPRNEGPARWREWRFSRLERAQNNKAGWNMTRRGCLGRSNRSIVSKFSQMFARSPRRSLRLPLRAESGGGRGESGRPRPTRRRRAPEVALQLRRHASASRDGDGGEAQRRQFFVSILRETRGDDGRRTDADGSLARGRTRGWIFSRPSSRSRTSTRGTCSNPSGSGTCADTAECASGKGEFERRRRRRVRVMTSLHRRELISSASFPGAVERLARTSRPGSSCRWISGTPSASCWRPSAPARWGTAPGASAARATLGTWRETRS